MTPMARESTNQPPAQDRRQPDALEFATRGGRDHLQRVESADVAESQRRNRQLLGARAEDDIRNFLTSIPKVFREQIEGFREVRRPALAEGQLR